MSDIQRYDVEMGWEETASDSVECAQMRTDPDGDYVTYADHVAALLTQDRQHMEELAVKVAEARDEGFPKRWEAAAQVEKAEQSGWHRGWRAGRADALSAAVAAVEALYRYEDGHRFMADEGPSEEDVIAAIKGVQP